MDIVTFLRFAEAIRAIYELGFEPREDSSPNARWSSTCHLSARVMIEPSDGSS